MTKVIQKEEIIALIERKIPNVTQAYQEKCNLTKHSSRRTIIVFKWKSARSLYAGDYTIFFFSSKKKRTLSWKCQQTELRLAVSSVTFREDTIQARWLDSEDNAGARFSPTDLTGGVRQGWTKQSTV